MKKEIKPQEETNQEFLEEGYYVYALIDPRNNEIFYVGKGQGLRATQHEEEVRRILNTTDDNSEINTLKQKRITDIQNAGKNVIIYLLRHGISAEIFPNVNEKVALELESIMIDFIHHVQNEDVSISKEQLTNIQNGYRTTERGFISFEEFRENRTAQFFKDDGLIFLPPIDNYIEGKDNVFKRAKGTWKIQDDDKRNSIQYILPVDITKHKIIGVFIPNKWSQGKDGRWSFTKKDVCSLDIISQKKYANLVSRVLGKEYRYRSQNDKFENWNTQFDKK